MLPCSTCCGCAPPLNHRTVLEEHTNRKVGSRRVFTLVFKNVLCSNSSISSTLNFLQHLASSLHFYPSRPHLMHSRPCTCLHLHFCLTRPRTTIDVGPYDLHHQWPSRNRTPSQCSQYGVLGQVPVLTSISTSPLQVHLMSLVRLSKTFHLFALTLAIFTTILIRLYNLY